MNVDLKQLKRKELRREIRFLRGRIRLLESRHHAHVKTITDLRKGIEQLTLTPEIKADTESAYKRGFAHARRSHLAWLQLATRQLMTDIQNDLASENGTEDNAEEKR